MAEDAEGVDDVDASKRSTRVNVGRGQCRCAVPDTCSAMLNLRSGMGIGAMRTGGYMGVVDSEELVVVCALGHQLSFFENERTECNNMMCSIYVVYNAV